MVTRFALVSLPWARRHALCSLTVQQACGEGAGARSGPVRDPALQLQAHRREPLRPGLTVPQPHAAVRVPPAGVPCGRALPQPELLPPPLPRDRGHQDRGPRLGPQDQAGPEEGESAVQVSCSHESHPLIRWYELFQWAPYDKTVGRFVVCCILCHSPGRFCVGVCG